jgi:alkylation response protein AidB-like acyl-CoA dehydrogenase
MSCATKTKDHYLFFQIDAGLLNASVDLHVGGLQFLVSIAQVCMAFYVAANAALAVYPFVTNGVATVICNHGSAAQKQRWKRREQVERGGVVMHKR